MGFKDGYWFLILFYTSCTRVGRWNASIGLKALPNEVDRVHTLLSLDLFPRLEPRDLRQYSIQVLNPDKSGWLFKNNEQNK